MRLLNNACNRLLYKYTIGMQGASIPTDDPDKLKSIISEQQKEIALLREQVHLLKHYRFGSHSETINPDQLPLINQNPDEYQSQIKNDQDQVAVKSHQRRKRTRLGFAEDLPARRVELDLEVSQKTCECCQSPLTRIGEEITRKVDYIPARVEVIEYARAKYACKACEETIKRARMPKFVLPKSFASPSLLSHLIVSKYVDHLPLNRIEKQFKRVGIYLPRSTMCDWMIHVAEKLEPIMREIRKIILLGKRIWTDDTILPLQNDDPNRKKIIQARLWVYIGGPITDPPLLFYEYSRTRSSKWPLEQLKDYRGYKHADGYPGYKPLHENGKVIFVACWAHARRKFYEASLITQHEGWANDALTMIARLYRVEHECKALSDKQRKKYRKKWATPILNEIKAWADSQINAVLPKSQLGKALQYMLNHWHGLIRYLDAGYLMPDNNKAEQHIRPIALGRKNFLFVGSDRGGRAAAIYYSLVESCKNYDLNPMEYLTDVLAQLPYCEIPEDYQALIPGNWKKE